MGLIVAKTREIALEAVKAVKVTYKDHKKPILTIAEALKYPNNDEMLEMYPEDEVKEGEVTLEHLEAAAAKEGGKDLTIDPVKTISGEFEIGAQHHFHLETQTCIVRPLEDGEYEIDCATQWIAGIQIVVARALNVQHNALDVRVSRHFVKKA